MSEALKSKALKMLPLMPLLLAAACTPRMTDVLPDERMLMSLPSPDNTTKDTLPAEKDWSEYYLLTAEVTESVNGMVKVVLGTTSLITRTQRPTVYDADAEYAEWGPYSEALDPVETVLWVDHDADSDVWTWGYQQWPKEDPSVKYDVIVGEVDKGATREASTGRFTIDFTMMDRLDPTTNVDGGSFMVDYALDPDGVAGTVDLLGIGEAALDASYAYAQVQGGDGQMDLTLQNDANPESGTDVLETYTMRSRWNADGVGRGDAKLTGGDLGLDEATGNECWDNGFEAVYRAESWSGLVEGDPAGCVFEAASYVGE